MDITFRNLIAFIFILFLGISTLSGCTVLQATIVSPTDTQPAVAPTTQVTPTHLVLSNSQPRRTPTNARPRRTTTPSAPIASAPTSAPGANDSGQSNAPPSDNRNLMLGNPSNAVHDSSSPNNYLIERPQYVLSYNRDHSIPNWVSWQVTSRDLGSVKRSNMFVSDTSLPDGWYQVTLNDYTGSGYDRGHMCPSGDRTATVRDNQATFTLTNIVPQAPDNNRSTWEHLEALSRTLVEQGHVLAIIAGGDGENGTIARGKVLVPRYTWKIIAVLPKGTKDVSRITADTPVIAIRVPNALTDKLGDWDQYRVTVASIEANTGYHFFTNLPPAVQQALKSRIDPMPGN